MSLEKKLTISHKTSKVAQEECEPINDVCDYIQNDTDLIISRDRCSDEVFNNVSDLNSKSLKTAHGLKFAHLNIRSLNSVTLNKIDQVRILLESKAIDVLALKPGSSRMYPTRKYVLMVTPCTVKVEFLSREVVE